MSDIKVEKEEDIPVNDDSVNLESQEDKNTEVDGEHEYEHEHEGKSASKNTNDDTNTSGNTNNSKKKKNNNMFVCKWVDCKKRNYPTLTSLVTHLSSTHLAHIAHLSPNTPIRYTCHWEGCSRYAMEQPSRFALISHCRTHTGEKPYFCPIPECEKHFTRSDALAKHVKGVHDLHSARDALALIKERIKKEKMAPIASDNDDFDEYEYLSVIDQDYDLRNPWWFNKNFVNTLANKDNSISAFYDQPFNTQQYKLASDRYHAYLENNDDEIIPSIEENEYLDYMSQYDDELQKVAKSISSSYTAPEDDGSMDFANTEELEDLKKIHNNLKTQLATATKINKTVSKQLSTSVKEKRRLWLMNQILLDGNVVIGLPEKADTGINDEDTKKVVLDKYDEELLSESVKTLH
ncbi:DEHA2C01276p [Debaryomyces hansenii CBS767]|uniref:DEHA2C01276p n=1 Tax=Debaryomyces hansenii (strain ATCC 36239 / CBS 767 / BCRC 21394 / JCM 1990 / NBRC 0083 / IGC 2968) TaxID=284592 RepID=Q6BVN3_DEBHA|nr:DEHA2C01276p [Debaryomyces hansenii CBS767]CAG85764.2 DEHA2C01276p [Debaryomyces hansenii CBS767]|eukprot:XP_457736.2 DEHA2C01276p [Debaryomyces hansenii CBS767]